MCEQFGSDSYLGRMFANLFEIIGCDPDSELAKKMHFDEYVAPRLANLESLPNTSSVVMSALAQTWQILNFEHPAGDFERLREEIFKKPIFPHRYARLVVDMAKALVWGRSVRRVSDQAEFTIFIPEDTDFGTKEIYLMLLRIVVALSFNVILNNLYTLQSFEASMQSWQDFFQHLAEKK